MSVMAATCRRFRLCLVAAALAVAFVQAAPVQDVPVNTIIEDYSDLLDILFPRDLNGALYALAVRLTPSFEPESQLVVKVLPNGTVSAEFFQVTGRTAWDSLSDSRLGRRALSIAELAKTVRVQRRTVDVDLDTANGWRTSLLDAVRASAQALEAGAREDQRPGTRTVRVVADGLGYLVWYSQGSVRMHWDFVDLDPESAKSTPVLRMIRWVADVMKTAERKVR